MHFVLYFSLMSQIKLISSPIERVQETIKIAYTASTDKVKDIWKDIKFPNSRWKVVEKQKSNLYSNLLWFWALPMQEVLKEFTEKAEKIQKETWKPELEVQDIISEQFLKGEFISGNPYTISQERVKILLQWFDKIDKKKPSSVIIWMRHGHRIWAELSDMWKLEAMHTWEELDLTNADLFFGTHQTIIESILISLIGGSKNLSILEARQALPTQWQEPYKTAQATEFWYGRDWEGKKLTIITNWAWEVFREREIKEAYNFLKNYNWK